MLTYADVCRREMSRSFQLLEPKTLHLTPFSRNSAPPSERDTPPHPPPVQASFPDASEGGAGMSRSEGGGGMSRSEASWVEAFPGDAAGILASEGVLWVRGCCCCVCVCVCVQNECARVFLSVLPFLCVLV
jgi:hypothetical protein